MFKRTNKKKLIEIATSDSIDPNELYEMEERAFEEFIRHREQNWQLLKSNSQSYDNLILTLSSAGLGLSIAIVKDVVALKLAIHTWMLIGSWVSFFSAIISILWSFVCGQGACRWRLQSVQDYYYLGIKESVNPWEKKTTYCNFASGVCFAAGLLMTIGFVSVNILAGNIKERESQMSEQKLVPPTGEKTIGTTTVSEGQGSVSATKLPPKAPTPTSSSQKSSERPKK